MDKTHYMRVYTNGLEVPTRFKPVFLLIIVICYFVTTLGSVGATAMNERSSRSHAIFSITVECSEKGPDGQHHVRMGKLHLVDLAVSTGIDILYYFNKMAGTSWSNLLYVLATHIKLLYLICIIIFT